MQIRWPRSRQTVSDDDGAPPATGDVEPVADETETQTILDPPPAGGMGGLTRRLVLNLGGPFWRSAGPPEPIVDEQPLRRDLYSVDQLARHARTLASWHQVGARVPRRSPLLERLEENQQLLERTYDQVVRAAEKGRRIAPAAEWLIDNFYLIEQQIRLARSHLPQEYAKQLPRLKTGPSAGRPRVYDIVLELISHVDGRVDSESLEAFVASYQSAEALQLGELWAVPIMLRLALIENLRRVAVRISMGQTEQDLADAWSQRIISAARRDPKSVVRVLAEMYEALEARSRELAGGPAAEVGVQLSSAFVAEFARRLQGQGPAVAFPLDWVTQVLAEQGQTVEQLVQAESQRQAADQVSIGNSISSLRFLESCNWREFVEAMSVVERVLRGDPAQVYPQQDFVTRDRYRHAVERTARRSPHTEGEVAELAMKLAREAEAEVEGGRRQHVGYWLVDEGLSALEREAGFRPTLGQKAARLGRAAPLGWFLGGVVVLTAIFAAGVLGWAIGRGLGALAVAAVTLPVIVAASQWAVGLVNWVVVNFVRPRPLARLELRDGVPLGLKSFVVVPAMLSSRGGVDQLVEHLEIRYLANREENLYFALLTDWPDAQTQLEPGDEAILQYAEQKVRALNHRHGFEDESRFFLLHRPRVWNDGEGVWMAWERKRGKLSQFNRLIAAHDGEGDVEAAEGAFHRIVGRRDVLAGVRYVITLDADTELPRDAARKLIGTAAHPLNRPIWDEERRRVVKGYGILQPRVDIDLPSAGRSWFARIMSGDPGVDPYTLAVSDVYQDAFAEGSFIGKGLYDPTYFEKACGDRFPENTILSHDLIESTFARSGLVSDVVFYEDHPASYLSDVARRHRWVRGDWQIAHYLLPWITDAQGQRVRNRPSGLSRWKIFDNLRRSVVTPAVLLAVVLVWLLRPSEAWAWTLLLLGYYFVPPLLSGLWTLAGKPRELPWEIHAGATLEQWSRNLARAGLGLLFLPFEAYKHVDAIARSGWRMLVSRRHLLEWTTSSEAERRARGDHRAFWESMAPAWLLAGGLLVWFALARPGMLAPTLPLLAAWFVSPSIAWFVSRPLRRRRLEIAPSDLNFLRKLARRTWSFFDTFVGAADNFLPPDNYQEAPVEVVANRTSPTNIGLGLLSQLTAHDFGYITLGQFLDRAERTFSSIERLERYRGHLLNWYDTRTLDPLTPRYVSSVDSGNFIASVHLLRIALREMIDAAPVGRQTWRGMEDSIRIFLDTVRGREKVGLPGESAPGKLKLSADLLGRLEALMAECAAGGPPKLAGAKMLLQKLTITASEAVAAVAATQHEEAKRWAGEFERHAARFAEELHHLCPWVDLVPSARPFQGTDAASRRRIALLNRTLEELEEYPSLRRVAALKQSVLPAIDKTLDEAESATLRPHVDLDYFHQLRRILFHAADRCESRIQSLQKLVERCDAFLDADWSLLYDRERHLLHIGYNVAERRLDAGYYDLLASEMRLGSFVLVATGGLPQEHWFSMGRNLTTSGSYAALLSWSGSMFEYLMPLLVMPTYPGTLLDQTYRGVVLRHIEYARQRGGVPWGASESGYYATDAQLNYQYRPFGVPGLGYKRGLGEDLVIAPYASVMAAMVAPADAVANLRRLRGEGKLGRYGFYEAIDYTPSRVKRGEREAVVRSFMAHHQAMSLLSLAYVLLDQPMQRRLMSEPVFRSSELLLHEKVPKVARVFPHAGEHAGSRRHAEVAGGTLRIFRTPHTPLPEVHLLSNGRLTVMVTAAGGGFTRFQGLAVTRWQEDATRDSWGTFIYIRDMESGEFWSNAFQPTLKRPERYEAIFSQARAEYRRTDEVGDGDGEIDCHTQISISPEDDVEVRRLTLTNNSSRARTIEITSYAEAVLADPRADAAHPAFQNLFVQTRLVRGRKGVLAKRRPRSSGERTPFMIHLMALHGMDAGEVQYETDRSAFIGRGRTLADPLAMYIDRLSDTQGSVLDPIVSVRRSVRVEAGESVTVDVVTGVAESHEAAHALFEKYHDRRLNDRVAELAWTHSQVVLRQLGATEEDAQLYGRLASSVIYSSPHRRAASDVIARNTRKQSELWAYGISGDLPIALVRVADRTRIGLVEQAVQAHAYWRRKGLACDLVIWNDDASGYRAELQEEIFAAVSAAGESGLLDKPGGIFVRRGEQIGEEDKILLQSVARVILTDKAGTLAEQIDRRVVPEAKVPRFVPAVPGRREPATAAELPERRLIFHNGIGGFTPDGKEYVTLTTAEGQTPAPWSNVLANPQFGTLLSEAGVGYTWFTNAREFRLTPWYNDAVSDVSGEGIYIRDEESGRFWSPTPLPARGAMPYVTRHGFGYSVFEYAEQGIGTETTIYVHRSQPVKFWHIRIHNTTERRRRVSLTGFVEWVLGDLRPQHAMQVQTVIEPRTGAVMARNPYNAEFDRRFAFFDCSEANKSVTGDRVEFLGRNGTLADPAAMYRTKLSGKTGAGLDPCAAVRTIIELGPDEEREVVFMLGAADDQQQGEELLSRFRSVTEARAALEENWAWWGRTLGTVYVDTPDRSVNVLVNGWLEYQVLASRYWGRTGYYQSGGAYGFRDQLQDVASLTFAEAGIIREHLLRAARHQFKEGDVQHWWHPPSGKGVRTHFSDDYMWLPLVAARYVRITGDTGVLDEEMPFLEGPPVPADQESIYDQFSYSTEIGSLYEHCRRAILYGVQTRGYGEHGLPLMGCGDWNDGMNLVGHQGRGESVWLGWFFIHTLLSFAPIASARGDGDFADLCRGEAEKIRANLERSAWDGQWYKRAWFDNGEPLGSSTNPECQIDSLPQSWAVLSGQGDPKRARQALEHVETRLVREDARLIQLFDPPFDNSHLEPGYIKGYVPGVRENGGQYTHAAIWTIMAFAELGEAEKAWRLFHLINPVNHGATPQGMATYKVEPYVAAADVYAVEPHVGRGGWTWYTGSAGWMYRLIVESLLGLRLEVDKLFINPRMPADWPGFELVYRFRDTHHRITVRRGEQQRMTVRIDGKEQRDQFIRLRDDRREHVVEVRLAASGAAAPAAPASAPARP